MKILYSWLREFIDTRLSPFQLQEALTMGGIEVSSCRFLGDGLDHVVVAKILEKKPHPNADKLSLCRVTDGEREYPIVCGAKNMAAGDHVALSKIGAKLPNGIEIKKAKIRGEISEGMLCSETELRLAEESAGIMILPADSVPGTPLAVALGLSDHLLEVEITPNRGDCLSVLGVAREVAALTGEKVVLPDTPIHEMGPEAKTLASVAVTDPDLCPRYSARVMTGLTIGPSPAWMQRRLSLCGIRPINNVVDITNYLLLEVGQPMHAFDLDRLAGGRIDVRRSGIEREFVTLDNVKRKALPEMLLIWDGERPVAVAGVMGGQNTEVLAETKRVLFESAHFAPSAIRFAARRMGISSESSYRFERGVDPAGTLYAVQRATSLLSQITQATVAPGIIDIGGDRDFTRTVPFRPEQADRIIGRVYGADSCRSIFDRLGFPVSVPEAGAWQVGVSSNRFDIEREIDLIEEIARLTGYDTIPTTFPGSETGPEFSADDRFTAAVERGSEYLRTQGFSQVINYSFVSEKELLRLGARIGFDAADAMRLANPLSDDMTVMRPDLLAGLLHNVSSNVRRFIDEIRLFETGKAFGKSYERFHFEEPRIAFALYGHRLPGAWSGAHEGVDFFDVKGISEGVLNVLGAGPVHFVPTGSRPFYVEGQAADIIMKGEIVGWVGVISHDLLSEFNIERPVCYAELRLPVALSNEPHPALHREIPKFPPVFRDYACIVPSVAAVGDILAMVRELSPEIASASVFDVFTSDKIGEGKKSIAFRVKLQPSDRTLTESEVNSIHTKILNLLDNRFGGKIRTS
ncbi:MAG TPA: phenylalanine--tRNA ligase subunit beta [Candidatus Deferrimicrobiaceae bacterium]